LDTAVSVADFRWSAFSDSKVLDDESTLTLPSLLGDCVAIKG